MEIKPKVMYPFQTEVAINLPRRNSPISGIGLACRCHRYRIAAAACTQGPSNIYMIAGKSALVIMTNVKLVILVSFNHFFLSLLLTCNRVVTARRYAIQMQPAGQIMRLRVLGHSAGGLSGFVRRGLWT
jgi:hypothetical protein